MGSQWTALAGTKYRSSVPDSNDPKKKDFFAAAKQMGYHLHKPGHYAKFSGMAHEETLLRFKKLAARCEFQLQDAYTQAFELWLDHIEHDMEKNKP